MVGSHIRKGKRNIGICKQHLRNQPTVIRHTVYVTSLPFALPNVSAVLQLSAFERLH